MLSLWRTMISREEAAMSRRLSLWGCGFRARATRQRTGRRRPDDAAERDVASDGDDGDEDNEDETDGSGREAEKCSDCSRHSLAALKSQPHREHVAEDGAESGECAANMQMRSFTRAGLRASSGVPERNK